MQNETQDSDHGSPKTRKTQTDANNCRPVALLCHAYKLLKNDSNIVLSVNR